MLYAALTFWLFVIVFTAWGVFALWSQLIKPRWVNTILLPGTLVAQLGHVLGLLVTGNSVRNTSLMDDTEDGDPQSDPPEHQTVPVIGPILLALLPLVACAAALYAADELLGGFSQRANLSVAQVLPTSVPAVWDLLRGAITACENVVVAIYLANPVRWPTLLFLYLAICLTVRMTPFEGTRRGALGAIALAGVSFALLGMVTKAVDGFVLSCWPMISFAVSMLLLLLLISLVVTGIVGIVRIIARNE